MKVPGLPNIIGQTYSVISQTPYSQGALNGDTELPDGYGLSPDVGHINKLRYLKFNAANSNTIYGQSSTVQPPALVLIPQIKF